MNCVYTYEVYFTQETSSIMLHFSWIPATSCEKKKKDFSSIPSSLSHRHHHGPPRAPRGPRVARVTRPRRGRRPAGWNRFRISAPTGADPPPAFPKMQKMKWVLHKVFQIRLRPKGEGLQPKSDGLQPRSDGLQSDSNPS